MAKPDRFDRMVDKASWRIYAPGTAEGMRERRDKAVAELLRRQHAAVVRQVRQAKQSHPSEMLWLMACDEILKKLAQWRRGTK